MRLFSSYDERRSIVADRLDGDQVRVGEWIDDLSRAFEDPVVDGASPAEGDLVMATGARPVPPA